MSKPLLTQTDICRQYGISDETWRRWRKARLTPDPIALPGAKRWKASDVERFFARTEPEGLRTLRRVS